MADRIDGRKLSRKQGPRLALYKNLAVSVLRYERVQTTEAKAKEIRGQVEHMITLAKRGDLAARRQVVSSLPNEPLVVTKLFDDLAPRFASRAGGYTRLLRVGFRRGDGSEIAQVELVGSEYNPRAKAEAAAAKAEAAPKPKGLGSRLSAAASRLRGKKKEAEGEAAEGEPKKPAKRAAKKKKAEE